MKAFLLYAILFIFANASLPANNTQKNTYDICPKEIVDTATTEKSNLHIEKTEADIVVFENFKVDDIKQKTPFVRGSFRFSAFRRKNNFNNQFKVKYEDKVKK
ncbi:hypothetical protein EDEG_03577 [Edhazardia aedis USNM 41457]|uniref:Uncharacterized protein n=1 Tax=Edhazardia aedis (strain USNM 41457) TaxID=1003232 RepID=J9D278_EDHAE|nr:hypothetical protein EDEG_03577 [Edhazardia aedis USNM 41457]|eukprot:EJW01951.1 hypothetical protein EDEG_03577 [Edhazardia aedis USNM 41457]